MESFNSVFVLHSIVIYISFLVCHTLNGLILCHAVIKVGAYTLFQWKKYKHKFM